MISEPDVLEGAASGFFVSWRSARKDLSSMANLCYFDQMNPERGKTS